MEVTVHVYDVTNSGSDKTNNTIMNINKIFKDAIGLGGIFHSAVQVYGDEEWSFGYCEQGSGVFHCPSTKNPMYTFRESIKLGLTTFSVSKVNQILREMSREWPGESYDLLAKNCNHFCDELCERLGVAKLPGWVNRFANAGDAAIEIAGNTAYKGFRIAPPRLMRLVFYQNSFRHRLRGVFLGFSAEFRQAKTEIVTASKVAYRFLAGIGSKESPGSSNNGGSPRFQPMWFKNLVTPGAKLSASPELENQDQDAVLQQRRQDAEEAPLRLNPDHHDI